MLRGLKLKAVYRSEDDSILEDFYIPALSVATSYQRAVGYFSASMLSFAAQGLSAFVANDGKMQLIFGGELQPDDEKAIRKGYDTRFISDRLGLMISDTIDSIADALCYRRLEALSWLVATGRLDIKFALRKRGMYHEKIGIIRDAEMDAIVFQGSANETAHALLPDFNFESINVFPCWREELSPHFTPYLRGFDRLWSNTARDTAVFDFPEAAARKLIKIAEKCRIPRPEAEIALAFPQTWQDIGSGGREPRIPAMLGEHELVMQEHQLLALNAWKANAFQGIMALATGAGKTITAIYGAIRLYEATKRLTLVVSVPYQNLADQWVEVLSLFNISAIRCYGGRNQWQSQLSEQSILFRADALPLLAIVVVNRTLQGEAFQEQLRDFAGDSLLWIGDECHHHSSQAMASVLPQQARMRLGLSATPESYSNPDATARLQGYYGKIGPRFTLGDALQAGVITPYDYHVFEVTLTDSETQSYHELSEQIAVMSSASGGIDADDPSDNRLKALLMQRARIIGNAKEKLDALEEVLQSRPPQPLTLFYCGDGSTEDEDTGDSMRQIDRVCQLLYDKGWKCATFTSRESREEREALLSAFKVGAIDALVAIRCLDEGIDVPACRTAYILASSRNPKQFIQRRGRILRKSAGKTSATIYDFLVRLPLPSGQIGNAERNLVRSELERVAEFANLARNSRGAAGTLLPVMKDYDLSHLLV